MRSWRRTYRLPCAETAEGLPTRGGEGARPGTVSQERFAELHPALRRLVLQRLADSAAGRPVPGAARFAEQVAGLRRTGTAMLDLGSGVRAVAEAGVLRAERP